MMKAGRGRIEALIDRIGLLPPSELALYDDGADHG